MTRFLIYAAAILLSVLPQSSFSQSKKPSNLGSILDPDDTVRIKKETSSEAGKSNFMLDQEFPELPEVLRWELALTTKAFKTTDNIRTRSDLITATSKGVEYLCLGELQSSFYQTVPPEDPACIRALRLLESLDAESPIARCARYGINSDLCISAYKTQKVTNTMPRNVLSKMAELRGAKFTSNSFENDLSVKLEQEKSRAASQQIQAELAKLPTLTKTDKKFAETEEKRNALLSQYLQQTCSLYRLVTVPAAVIEKIKKSRPPPKSNAGAKSGSSLEDLLTKGPFKATEDKNDKDLSLNHFRLIDSACLNAIKFVEERNKMHPAIPCRRDGLTSPTCISARRASPYAKGKGKSMPSGSGEGIERF